MTEGKVWLVGAGPGDTGLITVKGEQVLKEAQVVVYDHLVNPDLLARYGDGKRFINVGKQAGRHLIPQQEIQEILVRAVSYTHLDVYKRQGRSPAPSGYCTGPGERWLWWLPRGRGRTFGPPGSVLFPGS